MPHEQSPAHEARPMPTVTHLPTAAPSYIQVRRAGRRWAVDIVTPAPGKPLRTTLARADGFAAVVDFAKEVAAKQQRPLRLSKGVAA